MPAVSLEGKTFRKPMSLRKLSISYESRMICTPPCLYLHARTPDHTDELRNQERRQGLGREQALLCCERVIAKREREGERVREREREREEEGEGERERGWVGGCEAWRPRQALAQK